jgi:predicted PhzF superfamily epimerase YddE/YHI9
MTSCELDVFHSSSFSLITAFSGPNFEGNPACVVLVCQTPVLDDADIFPTSDQMQERAAHENQPATVFLAPLHNGRFAVRFYTPTSEMALCGHASLAVAYTLWARGLVADDVTDATLVTRSQTEVLVAKLGQQYSIQLPLLRHVAMEMDAKTRQLLYDVIGEERGVLFVGSNSADHVLVVLTPECFVTLAPTSDSLFEVFPRARIISLSTRGGLSVVNAAGHALSIPPRSGYVANTLHWWDEAHVVSRCFNRVQEDPVCAMAHAGIIPYWIDQLELRGQPVN